MSSEPEREPLIQQYMHWFDCREDVEDAFHVKIADEILLAAYHGEGYEGAAWVVCRRPDGSLYEVHGGHCSCYGLEDQWDEEDTTVEEIRARAEAGGYESALDAEGWGPKARERHIATFLKAAEWLAERTSTAYQASDIADE